MTSDTFRKRPGTTDKGKDYEDFTVASFVLQLLTDKSQNFKISSNDENFGAFDDIVLEIETENNLEEKYALQLKHLNTPKALALKALTEESGNYSIKKYFRSCQQIKENAPNHKLIILTNSGFKPKDGTQIEFSDDDEHFKLKIVINEAIGILNSSKTSDMCYKFEIVDSHSVKLEEYTDFFERFFLYPNQENADQIRRNTVTKFREMFSCQNSIAENYLRFVTEWSMREGIKEKLNKQMMQKGIALQLLSSFIHPPSFGLVDDNTKLLQKAISIFHTTIFEEEALEKVTKIWADAKSGFTDFNQINTLRKQYNISSNSVEDLNDTECTKLLWLMGKCPLIMVTENLSIFKAMELCRDQKFVLLGEDSHHLPKESVFRKLADLNRQPDIFDDVTKSFKCSLQGKEEIYLEELIQQNEEVEDIVTTNVLLDMANKTCFIGGDQEILPRPYISRSLSRNIVDFGYLETVDKDTVIMISNFPKELCDDFVDNFNIIFVNRRLEEESTINSEDIVTNKYDFSFVSQKVKMYVNEQEFSSKMFQEICRKNRTKKLHHFRMISDANLEWIQSRNGVNDLEQHLIADDFCAESELYCVANPNNINIVEADPGMGKSALLKSFKNNNPPTVFTVFLSSQDISSLSARLNGTHNEEEFTKFLLTTKLVQGTSFDKEFLKVQISKGHIVYLWDALDEIPDDALESITNLILTLSKKSLTQWVTCRYHLKKTLEKKFGVLSRTLTQFDTLQQNFYIQERLQSSFSEENIEDVITKIRTNIAHTDYCLILSVPLQIFMLTDLFLKDPKKYVNLLQRVVCVTDLYYHFVEETFNLYFREKGNVSSPNHILKKALELNKKTRIDNYEKSALKALFVEDSLQWQINCDEFLEEMQQGDPCGFILHLDEKRIVFFHNSYAEYFAASYFSKNWKNLRNFRKIIFERKHSNVRFFFDLLLAQNCEAHIAVLHKNFDALQRCDLTLKDSGGRSPLHIACSWGVQYPRLVVTKKDDFYMIDDTKDDHTSMKTESSDYIKILDFLLERCDINEKDALFNLNPKSYAEKLNCLVTVITIKKKQTFSLSESDSVICSILYYSVKFGDASVLNLFDKTKYVVTKSGGRSLLHLSVYKNNIACVQKLLMVQRYRKKINWHDYFGLTTPLILACLYGFDAIVDLLIENGAHVNKANVKFFTPLHAAAAAGHYKIVMTLVKKGANLNSVEMNKITPLLFACNSNHDKIVGFLLMCGALSNITMKGDTSPLCISAQKGFDQIVELLILFGANVDLPINDGRTPLHLAAYSGHEEVVRCLLSHGANPNTSETINGYTPLHAASALGHHQIVDALMKFDATPDFVDKEGLTPLYLACQNGHDQVALSLLTFKANPDIHTKYGVTPLSIACRQGHQKIVDQLLGFGANSNLATTNGWTPLYVACSCRHDQIALLLMSSGATNVNLGDKKGWTPLHIACSFGMHQIVEKLILSGANINSVDVDGVTPLHVAVDTGRKEIVELLIEKGGLIEACLKNGLSSLYMACSRGFEDVVVVLVEAGAMVDDDAVAIAEVKGFENIVRFLKTCGRYRRDGKKRKRNCCFL